MICEKCFHELPTGLNECPYCGTPVKQSHKDGDSVQKKKTGNEQDGLWNSSEEQGQAPKETPLVWKLLAAICFCLAAYFGKSVFSVHNYEFVYYSAGFILCLAAAASLLPGNRTMLFVCMLGGSTILAILGAQKFDVFLYYSFSMYSIFFMLPFVMSVLVILYALVAWKRIDCNDNDIRRKMDTITMALALSGVVCAVFCSVFYGYINNVELLAYGDIDAYDFFMHDTLGYLRYTLPLPAAVCFVDKLLREE